MGFLDACFFCHNNWGKCTCQFEGEFEFQGICIVEPNVGDNSIGFVNPFAYYGEDYIKAIAHNLIRRVK